MWTIFSFLKVTASVLLNWNDIWVNSCIQKTWVLFTISLELKLHVLFRASLYQKKKCSRSFVWNWLLGTLVLLKLLWILLWKSYGLLGTLVLGEQFADVGRFQQLIGKLIYHTITHILLSQKKYVLDLLSETKFLGAHPVDIPMNSTVKFDGEHGELFTDVDLEITYVIGVVDQYMHVPSHWVCLPYLTLFLTGLPLPCQLLVSVILTGMVITLIGGVLIAIVPLLEVI